MVALRSFSPQEIRNAILEVTQSFNSSMSESELKNHVVEILTESSHFDDEDNIIIQRNINDLVSSGKLTHHNHDYQFNSNNKSKDDSDYTVRELESPYDEIMMAEGNHILYSVGSQYYQDSWTTLKVGKTIIVELIREKTNPYDENAIALCHNNKVLGHLTRSDAADFSETIELINNSGLTVNVYGEVLSSNDDINYHYLKLFIPSVEELRNKILG